jgi:hypothetical protein
MGSSSKTSIKGLELPAPQLRLAPAIAALAPPKTRKNSRLWIRFIFAFTSEFLNPPKAVYPDQQNRRDEVFAAVTPIH